MSSNQVGLLYELQKVDSDIFYLINQKNNKPKIIEKEKEKIKQTNEKISSAKEKLKSLRIEIKNKELDLLDKENKIKKLSQQLNTVRTNKEYSSIVVETNNIKADKSILEEEILQGFGKIEQIEAEIKSYEKELIELEEELNKLCERTNLEIKELERAIAEKEAERKKIVDKITDKELLEKYEKLLEKKPDKIAVAEVREESCQGCHMSITKQELNLLLLGKDVISCRNCSRILYIRDEYREESLANTDSKDSYSS